MPQALAYRILYQILSNSFLHPLCHLLVNIVDKSLLAPKASAQRMRDLHCAIGALFAREQSDSQKV